VHDQEVFTSPTDDLERFEAAVQDLTPEQVMAELRSELRGDGPLVFLSSPTPIEGGTDAVMSALAEAQATTVDAGHQEQAQTWPYTDFGPAGQIVERARTEDIDTTTVRFANGVRLTIKPTDFRDDEILVSVNLAGGRLTLPNDRVLPTWAAPSAVIEGGLGRLSREDMEAVLAANVVSTRFGLSDGEWVLAGATRPEDLSIQLQALAAYLSDAAFRPEAFERMRVAYLAALPQIDATPGGAFGLGAGRILHGGDARWAVPTTEDVSSARLDDLQALIEPVLASAPIEVVIVGDVDVETAIRDVAATLGALPPRAEAAMPNAQVTFPAGQPETVLTHSGRADQGMAMMGWSTTDAPSDVYQSRVVNILAAVMQLRLIDELREGQAVTYSPSAGSSPSWDIPGYGYLSAAIEAPPERLDGFFRDVEEIAAQLRDTPISADELERARRPVIESLQRSRAGNEYWLGNLSGIQTEATRLPAIRSVVDDFSRITPTDIQAAARQYLVPERAWRARVIPEAAN